MYPDKYRLGFVARFIAAALERKLPAYPAWSQAAEDELTTLALAELAAVKRQFAEVAEDADYLVAMDRAIREILLPRYFTEAKRELAAAARDYGTWRGGDLVARAAYAGAGLATGLVAVWLPNSLVPIESFFFPLALFALGPFFPDVQVWYAKRRHRKRLEQIARDLDQAETQLDLYRPLSSLGEPAPVPRREAAPEAPAAPGAVPRREKIH